MQATIRHHLKHPPNGWITESINTHVDGSVFAKIKAWRYAKKKLKKRLVDNKPDIIHIHTATNFSWWRKLRAVKMCIKFQVPVILQIHAGNFHMFLLNKPPAAREFFHLTKHKLVTPVALTPRHKREIGLSNMEVIGSPAPTITKIDPQTREKNLLILLARPSPIKGHQLAIDAVQKLRNRGQDVTLQLSGIESSHRWVRNLDQKDGIHARGWLSGKEKNELLHKAGILLIPSVFEGMPVCAMEALSCGLPVIASSACEGILGDGGIIVEKLDSESWANAISEILNDVDKWQQMALNAPSAIAQQTPEVLGKKWSKLYQKALNEVGN